MVENVGGPMPSFASKRVNLRHIMKVRVHSSYIYLLPSGVSSWGEIRLGGRAI